MRATLVILLLAQWAKATLAHTTFSLSQVLNEGFKEDAISALSRAHAKFIGGNSELQVKFKTAAGRRHFRQLLRTPVNKYRF